MIADVAIDHPHALPQDHHPLEGCTGVEAFLAGISPTFWAHIPLLIGQIHNDLMLMENGVNCLVTFPTGSTHNRDVDSSMMEHANVCANVYPRVIPISKCKLVGTIVYSERKSNGCVNYVVDDGTGLIDCLHWDAENDDFEGLPPLTGQRDPECEIFAPGAVVRVMGRIQCVAVDGSLSAEFELPAHQGSNDGQMVSTTCRCFVSVVREVHASVVEPVRALSRANPHSLDCEARHWMDCIRTQQRHLHQEQLSRTGGPIGTTLLSPLDVLEILGTNISEQVAERNNLPSADDSTGLWRLFGLNCRCNNPLIQEALLYCHCIATPEGLDKDFAFRDRLLEMLLHAERLKIGSTASEFPELETQKLDDNDDTELDVHTDDHSNHFQFSYRDIIRNDELNQVAAAQMEKLGQEPALAQQLRRSTFRALCKDGILFLLRPEDDSYMLVSRTHVLEPHVKRGMTCESSAERTRFFSARPEYLQAVPRERILFVRRCLAERAASPTT
jgi:hypothetical protein